jgi:hypothetical protein
MRLFKHLSAYTVSEIVQNFAVGEYPARGVKCSSTAGASVATYSKRGFVRDFHRQSIKAFTSVSDGGGCVVGMA